MATRVSFVIPRREIEQTGVTFKRVTDDGLHGELTIRQNHLIWRSRKEQYSYEVPWGDFEVYAVKNGRKVRQKTTPVKGSKKLKDSAP